MKKKINCKNTILITGGSGYIGSCLSKYLAKEYRVFSLDKNNKNPFLDSKISHFKCNLNNKKKLIILLKKINPKIIIHLAGQSTIDMVEKKKDDYIIDNFLATKSLIEVVRYLKIKNLIFSSSAAVYDNVNKLLSENSKIKSNNSYGLSKIRCEEFIIKQLKLIKTRYCILRFFNVVSSIKKYNIGEFHNPETHLIPIIINSLFQKKYINIYGANYKTKDGTCMRDYVHIIDILRGIKKAVKYLENKKNKSNIFNLGSGTCYSVMEIINHCSNISKIKAKINVIKPRKYDVDSLLCKISKAKKILSWKPKYSNLKKIISDEIWWFKFLKKNKINRKLIY